MPIVAAGAGGDPVEATPGEQPRATECGGRLLTTAGAASSTNLTGGLSHQTQGWRHAWRTLPTTDVPNPSDRPPGYTHLPFLALPPLMESPPTTLSPDSAPSQGGPSLQEEGQDLKVDTWQGGPGHWPPWTPRPGTFPQGEGVLLVTAEQPRKGEAQIWCVKVVSILML